MMTKDPRPLVALALVALISAGCGSSATSQTASTAGTTNAAGRTDDTGTTSSTSTTDRAGSTATTDNAGKASNGTSADRVRRLPAQSSRPGTLPPQSSDGRHQPERTLGASAPSPSSPPR